MTWTIGCVWLALAFVALIAGEPDAMWAGVIMANIWFAASLS